MRTTITLVAVLTLLTACQSTSELKNEVEMPFYDHPEGIDAERISPCACIDYTPFINGQG